MLHSEPNATILMVTLHVAELDVGFDIESVPPVLVTSLRVKMKKLGNPAVISPTQATGVPENDSEKLKDTVAGAPPEEPPEILVLTLTDVVTIFFKPVVVE